MTDDAQTSASRGRDLKKKKDASLYLLDVNCQVCFQLNQKKKKTDIPIDHKLERDKLIV